MNIPTLRGLIRRRILLNYRVEPEVVRAILPDRFRPKLVRGHAIAGVGWGSGLKGRDSKAQAVRPGSGIGD